MNQTQILHMNSMSMFRPVLSIQNVAQLKAAILHSVAAQRPYYKDELRPSAKVLNSVVASFESSVTEIELNGMIEEVLKDMDRRAEGRADLRSRRNTFLH